MNTEFDEVSCNLFVHCHSNASALIDTCFTVAGVRDRLNVTTISVAAEDGAFQEPIGFPSVPGSAISLMVSCAEYGDLTACHLFQHLSEDAASVVWRRTAFFASKHVLEISPHTHHRRYLRHGSNETIVTGAFAQMEEAVRKEEVEETDKEEGDAHAPSPPPRFTIGLVSNCLKSDQALATVLRDFELFIGLTLTQRHARLSLCAGLRSTSVSLRWAPQEGRVTPFAPLPVITALLMDRRTELQSSAKVSVDSQDAQGHLFCFPGYTTARLFLGSPVGSELRGVCTKWVPHPPLEHALEYLYSGKALESGEDEAMQCESPSADEGSQMATGADRDATLPFFEGDDDGGSRQPGLRCRGEHRKGAALYELRGLKKAISITINFPNLYVTQEGEHLIGVELEVNDAYKPFIPVQCAHLRPFLVVGQDDG